MCSMYSVSLDYDYPTGRRGSIPNSNDENDEQSDEFEEDLGNFLQFYSFYSLIVLQRMNSKKIWVNFYSFTGCRT